MARFFRSVVWREDPLRLLARIPIALYSAWVRTIYPFAAIGRHVEIHYTWDFRRYLAHRVKLGNSVIIGKGVHFGVYCPNEEKGEPMIVIEDGCGIYGNTQISARNCVHIERDVIVSANALIMDHNHEFKDVTLPIKDQGISEGGTIRIEQGCWIGRGAAIVCNQGELVIGRNSVVAANALVTKSCPPYSVLVGNPARVATQFDPLKGIWMGLPGRAPRPNGDKANERDLVREPSGR
jgi:acetyltransferase-like isoleucine patch superfamily enzyme